MRCSSPNCITRDLGRLYIFFPEEEHQMWKIKWSRSTEGTNGNPPVHVDVLGECVVRSLSGVTFTYCPFGSFRLM